MIDSKHPNVLVTDYAWPDLVIEQEVLNDVAARLVAAPAPVPGAPSDLRDLAREASAIMTNWATVGGDVLDVASHCVVVARYGVGVDNIDVACASELGIVVTNVPDYCVDEVAEHTIALMLSVARHVCEFDRQTRAGVWDNQAAGVLRRCRGQTLGLVGYGRIARAVATRARAFGMTIATFGSSRADTAEPSPDIVASSLEELLQRSDIVSLHVPLTSATAGMIGTEQLAQMKPHATLVNTARGGLIDLPALERALVGGTLSGAAVDVLDREPPPADWLKGRPPNLIVTPHAAFFSAESIADLQLRTAQSVRSCLLGETPTNVVNPHVLHSPHARLRIGLPESRGGPHV